MGDSDHLVRCKDGLDCYEAMRIRVNTTGDNCIYIYLIYINKKNIVYHIDIV